VANLNITNIPAPRVPFIDERTGLMAREWYRFFLNLFVLTGSGNNPITLEELQLGPPNQPDLTELLIQINQNIAPQYEDQSGDFLATLDTAQLMSMMSRFENAEAAIQGAYLQPVVQTGTIANYNLDGSPTAGGVAYGTGPALAVSAAGTVGQVLTSAGAGTPTWTAAASGTVTSVSVVSANGLAGTVATATTTPAITLSTTITGLLKGNGTAISAAASGTDYAPATSGTSILYGNGAGGFSNVTIGTGVAFSAGTLSATGSGGTVTSVTGTAPVVSSGGTTPAISMAAATTSVNGYLTSTDWNTFNGKGSGSVTSVAQSFTGGLISVAGSPITTSGTLALTVAGTSGGIPYFSSASTWASSAALAAGAIVLGGGAGVTPATTTTGTGVVTALGVNTGTAGAFVVNGGALGTPSSGTVTNLTGTASINTNGAHNGTVGATTPNTGAFTTGTFSSTLGVTGVATVGTSSAGQLIIVGPRNNTAALRITANAGESWDFTTTNTTGSTDTLSLGVQGGSTNVTFTDNGTTALNGNTSVTGTLNTSGITTVGSVSSSITGTISTASNAITTDYRNASTGAYFHYLSTSRGSAYIGLEGAAGTLLDPTSLAGATIIGSVGAQALQLFTTGTVRMTVAAGGALGITGIVTMSAYGAGAATFSAAGVISSVSDETWKIKDGVPTDPDAMLQKLTPGYWFYNEEKRDTFGKDRQLGFYAQNVNKAIGPEAAPEPEDGKPWGYYDRSVLAVTVMSLQKALGTIQELTLSQQTHEGQIQDLLARIAELEKRLA